MFGSEHRDHEEEEHDIRVLGRKLDFALQLLEKIWAARHVPRPAVTIQILFGPIGDKMATAILHLSDHSVTASLVATDNDGNIVPLPSPPQWSLSADGIVTMTVAADGMSASFAPASPGTVTVNVVAEGDPQPGVDTLHATGDINVLAAEATKVELTFGAVS